VLSNDETGSSTVGWGMVYYVHDLLVNAGLTNLSIDVTEVGWCTNQASEPAGYTLVAMSVTYVTEAQKDSNISIVINQLATVSWIHGLWYYNLYPYRLSDNTWTSFGLYEPGTGTQRFICLWSSDSSLGDFSDSCSSQ